MYRQSINIHNNIFVYVHFNSLFDCHSINIHNNIFVHVHFTMLFVLYLICPFNVLYYNIIDILTFPCIAHYVHDTCLVL